MDEDDLLPPASMEDLDEYLDMLYQVGTGEERGGQEKAEEERQTQLHLSCTADVTVS